MAWVRQVGTTLIPWGPERPAAWLAPACGIGVEAGWAATRLAALPFELAAHSVRRLTTRHNHALPPDPDAPQPTGAGMPVLLVHGLIERGSDFTPLRQGLGDSAGPCVAVHYSAFGPDLRHTARILGDQVQQMRARSGGQPVAVIGHSLGGLIARYYVQRLGGDAHVPLVITLATPHGGTAAALWAPPHPLLRQLRPGSELLTELAAPAPGCRTRFVAFYSDLDEVVIPADRARIDHPDLRAHNVLVHGVGHLTLPLHKPVIDQVRAALTEAQQAEPAA
jgi:pimeloyl-ACP methyl ester carboxylesterase